METFSALLAICAWNSPVAGEFTAQRPVTRTFDVFFDLHLNKRLSKQWQGWWFETLSRPLWRHCNVIWFFSLQFGWRRGSQDLSSEDLSARTDDSSVAKLRENLLRLREHLDHVQKKAEIGDPSEDAAALAGSPDPVDRIQIKELPDDQTKEENDKEDLAMMSSQQTDYTIETNEDYVPNEGEPDEETPRVETINLKSVREEPSPARPNSADSLDESDHGVSPDTSHRGTNDSAYASDRHSYSSRQPRRLTGEDTSEDSATEK